MLGVSRGSIAKPNNRIIKKALMQAETHPYMLAELGSILMVLARLQLEQVGMLVVLRIMEPEIIQLIL